MSSRLDTTQSLIPGEYYHIYNQGNGGQLIYYQEENYRYFLKQYAKYMLGYWETFAYALLPNHFHLLIKVRSESEILEVACEDFGKVSKNFLSKFGYKGDSIDLLNLPDLVNLIAGEDQFKSTFEAKNREEFKQCLLQWDCQRTLSPVFVRLRESH